jgi:hypothetical protein
MAGGGTSSGAAISAYPPGVASAVRDTHANKYLYLSGPSLEYIYKVNPACTSSFYAGAGSFGFSGDGGPATLAKLSTPKCLAINSSGNLYVADEFNYQSVVLTQSRHYFGRGGIFVGA